MCTARNNNDKIMSDTFVVERERKKAEKAKKFADKKAKTAEASASPAASKTKEKKAIQEAQKDEHLPEYVEETPPGQKKSMSRSTNPWRALLRYYSLKASGRSISQGLYS